MLRIDYIGSAFVCLIIFGLFALAISNVSNMELGFLLKDCGWNSSISLTCRTNS